MSQQPEIDHPENTDLEFPESQVERYIETNRPYQEDIMEQECSSPAEKHYKESPELKGKVNTSKVIHTLLPNKLT